MTESPLTLTLDIGTSSTRVLLWDSAGHEVEGVRAQIPYQMHTTPEGGVEMPAEEFLHYVGDCIDQALVQAGAKASSVRAVGISTFWHSVIGLDGQGEPLTPIYNWSDTRSATIARRLRTDMDSAAIHARTGCVLHPSYYPAKLVWLRETQPVLFHKVTRWVSPSEYLFRRFFGMDACRVSVSMASGTGLLHQERCEWDTETLSALQLSEEMLSPIVDLKQGSQGLLPEFAKRWPALQNVPFFPAVGDGACGNVGSGCLSPERLALNLGTSGAIRVLWEEDRSQKSEVRSTERHPTPNTQPLNGLWRYRVDRARPMMGAAFSDGGHVHAWMLKTLQLPPEAELNEALAKMEPGAHGLTFLPYLAGERSMGWNPEARASLIGMNLDTSPIEMMRASMEAVALQFALAAQQLRSVFPQAKEIVASGGALGHSPVWAQIFADALGQPLHLAAEPEASSRGAALLAMEAAGIIGNAAELEARLGQTYLPHDIHHAHYREMLERQQHYYNQVITQQG